MSMDSLIKNAYIHIKAIELCIEHHLRMPALILIYSGIDIFSALNRPANKEDSTREDFKNWCERYLLSSGELSCSANDLYAARCGIVHANTPESKLSREQKANEIIYSWGNQSPEPLQNVLQRIGNTSRVIRVETLEKLFKQGVNEFLKEIKMDEPRLLLIVNRAQKLFKDQPPLKWRDS